MLAALVFAMAAMTATTRLAVVADIHYDPQYSPQSSVHSAGSCRTPDPSRVPSPFGQYGCETPAALLDLLAKSLESVSPDAIVLMGDIIAGDIHDPAERLAALNKVFLSLDILDDVPIVPILGATDLDLGRSITQQLKDIFDVYAKYLQPSLIEAMHSTFMYGGFYSFAADTIELFPAREKLTFIVLSTAILSESYTGGDVAADDQMYFLENALTAAREKGHRVIILSHSPIMVSSHTGTYNMKQEYADSILKLVLSYRDVIAGYYCAQYHRDEYKLATAENGHGVPVFVHPAVSPSANSNPGYRLSTISEKGVLMDYSNYYTSITRLNAAANGVGGKPDNATGNFCVSYTFSEAYGPSILEFIDTPANEKRRLVDDGWCTYRMMKALNAAIMADVKVWNVFSAFSTNLYAEKKNQYLCAGRVSDSATYEECMKKHS